MVLRGQFALPLFFVCSLALAQPPEAPANRGAPVSLVPFERILRANQEPQNWIALNAATGKTIWIYKYKPEAAARNCCGQETSGLAILSDKIFLAALDNTVIAINSKTVTEVWRTQAADPKQGYAMTHAPLAIKDKVIAGVVGAKLGVNA